MSQDEIRTTNWPLAALGVLQEVSGHSEADTRIIMDEIRKRGYVLVPVRDIPNEAVGEVMAWTGCASPDLAWEGLNCALNMLGIEWPDDPTALEHLRKLGSGESSLADWQAYKDNTYVE